MNATHFFDIHSFSSSVGVVTLAQESAPPIKGAPGAEQTQQGQSSQPLGPGGQGQQGQGQGAPPPGPIGGEIFVVVLLLIVFMFVLQAFSARKEKKKRQEMLTSLARHDRVQTVGGVIGTIAEIRDDEVVLKVDESTNTKIRFSRASVQQVLKKAGGESAETPTQVQQEPEKVNV